MQVGHVGDAILGLSQVVVTFGANLLVQSTILICVGFLAVYLFRRNGAVVQSLIMRATLIAVIACPFVAFIIHDSGNGLTVTIPTVYQDSAPLSASADIKSISRGPASVRMKPVLSMMQPDREERQVVGSPSGMPSLIEMFWENVVKPQSIDLKKILYVVSAGIWFVMSIVSLGRLILDSLYIYWLRRNAYDADVAVLKRAKLLARDFESEPPIVLVSPDVGSPFVSGLLRPVLFIPMGIDVTREVLIHEFGHMKRNDYLWNLCGHIASALMPFPIMVRLLTARLEDLSDYICDDYVITYSRNSRPYLHQLVDIAERFCPTRMERVFGVGIVRIRSAIGKRIQRLVNRTGNVLVTARMRVILAVSLLTAAATMLTGFVTIDAYQEIAKNDIDIFEFNTMSAPTNSFYQEWQQSARFTRPVLESDAIDTPESSDLPVPADMTVNEDVIEPVPAHSSAHGIESASSQKEETVDAIVLSPASQSLPPENDGIASHGTEQVIVDDPGMAFLDVLEERIVLTSEFYEFLSSLETVDECVQTGKKMLDKGDYAHAEHVFIHALTMDSKNPTLYNYLGMTYYRLRKYDQALVSYKNAVSLNEKFSVAYYNMGDVLFELGNLDSAMKYYKIAISMNPALTRNSRPFYLGNIIRQVKY